MSRTGYDIRMRAAIPTLFVFLMLGASSAVAEFKAGGAAVDVTPQELPVIRNGSFVEGQARLVVDPLFARALVLQNNDDKIALVVVDSCMIDREFCDRVKREAGEKTGIASDKILISATHTHSAPSVMDYCLGSRKDPVYSEYLPGKIVEVIAAADAKLRPAKVASVRFDAGAFTKNRRWSFRSGKEGTDPFGEPTVRANMHPGYQNPNGIGETGPTDPWFTILSIRDAEDRSLGLLGNFSMHYFSGHAGLSADYFGHYVRAVREKLAAGNKDFVAMLSQGTSGDLWRADYSEPRPAKEITIEEYAEKLAALTAGALEGVEYKAEVPLAMAETRLKIRRRVPDEKRLAWARGVLKEMGDNRPRNRPEVYAEQAIYLHENPEAEVVLQAVRIGGLGITAMPNEVYALTGLKLKYRSPLALTMNIELANGASGYIPPPEQFPLGGYNTWPARTAGLVPEAETQIAESCLRLLEEVSGRERRRYSEPPTDYALAVLKAKPQAFWRLGDLDGIVPRDEAAGQLEVRYEPGVVFHLPGIRRSRCAHFAGGRVASEMAKDSEQYSTSFWFWNGVQHDARPVTGYLFSRGADGDEEAAGEHLGIGGTHSHGGRLIVYNGNERKDLLAGERDLGIKKWHHVAIVREGGNITVYLDGQEEIRSKLPATHGGSKSIFFGGRNDNFSNLEGRMDEIAFFDRVLTAKEVRRMYAASAPMDSPPLDPKQSLNSIHVKEGFAVEIVAAEPLVMDPVAVDWAQDGSVWVAEMADYPYGVEGGGRVVRLVDKNGDGFPDERQLALSGLSFPAGVMAWGKGVIVSAAPDILYAEDRDGDGAAEYVEKWFSGFIEGNQQLRVNGLRIGLDGWIYCASGGHHAGFGTKTVITSHKTGEKIALGSRDFRFKPDGRLEPESGPSQFGRVRDDFGNWFGVQNAHPLWHYVLPDHYLRRNPDAAAPDPRKQLRDHQPRLFPAKAAQKRFHGFDHVGRYTSACGISIYRDDLLFPRKSDETIAFTCAPFHNVVQRHLLKPDGVSFSAQRADDGEVDFFASRDRWCRPVMSRTAPDGSLWVVDMYRYMIEHPDWLPPEGKDELRPHYREGENRGRIYRIYPKGKKPEPFTGLHKGMKSDNGIVLDLALRSGVEVTGDSPSYVATVVGARDLSQSLADSPDPRLRALALQALERYEEPSDLDSWVEDLSGHVRLQLAFSLGEWDSPEAAACLVKLALKDGSDPYMRAAILSSAVPHFDELFSALVTDERADQELVGVLLSMAPEDKAVELLADVKNVTNAQLGNAAQWVLRNPGSLRKFTELVDLAQQFLASERVPMDRRVAAVPLSVQATERFPEPALAHPELIRASIDACCERGLGAEVVGQWKSFSPKMRARAIDHCLLSVTNTLALISAAGDVILPVEFSASQRQRLLKSKDREIRKRAEEIFGAIDGSRVEVVKRYVPALAREGNVEKGRAHFRALCATCHQLEGEGKSVGPDLLSITNRSRQALLSAILEPNRNIEPRYLSYSAQGRDSVLAFGMIAAETATSVIFRLPDGSEKSVSRQEIVSIDGAGLSLMPDGLESGIDVEGMADLLSYLEAQLGK